MEIITVPVGALSTNAYVVYDETRADAVVIDPGADAEKINRALNGRQVSSFLLTHGHCDHIQALDALRSGARVAIHALDAPMLTSAEKNLSAMMRADFVVKPADLFVADGMRFEAAGLEIEVIHTPGHTPGSVCYRIGNVLFSGDTLFCDGYGRYDFPGGDRQALFASLRRLCGLSGVEQVYPGHNEATTLAREAWRYL